MGILKNRQVEPVYIKYISEAEVKKIFLIKLLKLYAKNMSYTHKNPTLATVFNCFIFMTFSRFVETQWANSDKIFKQESWLIPKLWFEQTIVRQVLCIDKMWFILNQNWKQKMSSVDTGRGRDGTRHTLGLL